MRILQKITFSQRIWLCTDCTMISADVFFITSQPGRSVAVGHAICEFTMESQEADRDVLGAVFWDPRPPIVH